MVRFIPLELCIAALLVAPVMAEVADVQPAADTTLHAVSPASNMGGHSHVAIGTTAKHTPARGLFRFDLSGIPTNAVVNGVTITFTLPPLNRLDSTNAAYVIHRMLKAWGEGTKVGNLGATATAGEASWQSSAVPETWTAPGAEGDYAIPASATQRLGPSPGVYMIPSTQGLVADVQHWVSRPSENFGWMLKAEDESIAQSARQVASRETEDGARLHVEYTVETAAELRITTIERVNTNVVIRWTGGQASVAVERAIELNGTWSKVGESALGELTNELAGPRAFLRLRTE